MDEVVSTLIGRATGRVPGGPRDWSVALLLILVYDLIVRVDGTIVAAMSVLKGAGVERIGLVTEPEQYQ